MAVVRANAGDQRRRSGSRGPAPRTRAGEETALAVLHQDEAQAERLSALSRLVAAGGGLLVAGGWALTVPTAAGVLLVGAALAAITVYAVIIMVVQWRRFRPWVGYLGMTLDVLALGGILAALAIFYPWPGDTASVLHFPAWLFFLVIIAGNALSFQQGRIAAAGGLSILVTLALAVFAFSSGAKFGSVVDDFSGSSLSLAGVATRVAVLALVTGMLAQAGSRARATIRRAASAEAAAATYGRYFSPKVAQRLLDGVGGRLEGQQVDATIIQSDVRGFTTFSEKMTPEDVLKLLNIYFDAMLEVLFKFDGTVIGFQGDGMLAAFGVPEARSDDADRALRAVQEMLRTVELMSVPGGPTPGLRIGIAMHSGYVVAGNLGSKRRMEYTVLGDTVNTAARIEGLNKEMGTTLLITDATVARLTSRDGLCSLGRVELRGRAEPVELFTPDALIEVKG